MLRVMLGVGGAALIGLGVFGGPILENGHQAVVSFFEPDTVVAEPVAGVAVAAETALQSNEKMVDSAVIEPATETVVLAAVDTNLVVEVSGNVAEVQASSKNEPVLLKTSTVQPAVIDASALLPKEAEVNEIVKTTAGSGADNTLFVLKERVNLREGPSIDHPIVLQLDVGQELMEFKRDGKWVHVGAYGTSGKIGWVHGTLVGKN